MNNKLTIIVLACLVISLASCNKKIEEEAPVKSKREIPIIPVTVIEVNASDYYEYGEYYGRVQGINRASLICPMGGTVDSVTAVEGMSVARGDSLGKISAEKAQVAYRSATLNEKISRENYITLKNFLQTGNSSQRDVDRAHLNWLNSQSQLIDAQKDYAGAFCLAPISGVIVARNIDRADIILPGFESFLIEDLSQMEVKIGIPEADMKGVKEGTTADVTLDLYPGRVWQGKLTRYSRRSSDNNLTFNATVIVDNRDRAIFSGTTAKVKLLRNSFLKHIVLPIDAIIYEDSRIYVMVVKDNRVTKRYIELATSNVEKCVVLSGLEVGETIVQEGLHLLVDTQEVSIIGGEK